MNKLLAFLVLASALIAPGHATVQYTSSTEFLAQVAPGAFTETFGQADYSVPQTVNFSNGVYGYSAFAQAGLWFNGAAMTTSAGVDSLVITFTGAPVTAIGGNFYNTNNFDVFIATTIVVALSDGTSLAFAPASVADSYRGFVSDVAIASITLSTLQNTHFAGVDNFTIGSAILDAPGEVPEPASLALLGAGLLGAAAARRRRQV